MLLNSLRNPVCHEAAEDLREAVEAEPYADAGALLFFGVPLRCEEGEARRDCCFEDTEEEAYGYGAGIALYGCHAAEDEAPHYDAEGGVFG